MDNSVGSSNFITMRKFLGEENNFDNPEKAFGVVVPFPFEFSTSYGAGTANGPGAIIEASQYVELYDEVFDQEIYKNGILTSRSIKLTNNPEQSLQKIEDHVRKYLTKDKFIVALGGEHSISRAVFAPFHEKYDNLSILQLDAHADLRYSYEDSIYSHASVMRRIWEINRNIVQCGIRSLSEEEAVFIKENQINTFFAHMLKDKNNWDEVISRLNKNIYLTIDVDFFDPAIVPSTGTPEPGGFFWDETIHFLEKLFFKKNVVGCDVVELSPIQNIHHADFMIAKLVYKIFGFKWKSQRSA
jgi:agmatinase